MSIGGTKFETKYFKGKPGVFLDQRKTTKKLGTKSQMKYPLKKVTGDVESHSSANKHQRSKAAARLVKNEQTALNIKQAASSGNSKSKEARSTSDKTFSESVTLTQDQLNFILASVGKLAISSATFENNMLFSEQHIDKDEDKDKENNCEINVNRDTKSNGNNHRLQEDDGGNRLAGFMLPLGCENSKVKDDVKVQQPVTSVPKSYLTLAEKKKLQWSQERVEREATYNPWGRPGAGAPLKSVSGQVLADYRTRKEYLQTTTPVQEQNEASLLVIAQSEPTASQVTATNSTPPLPWASGTAEANHIPPAMRSSFLIGQLAPDESRYYSTREQEKRKWLEELENQREMKRVEKLIEKEKAKLFDLKLLAAIEEVSNTQETQIGPVAKKRGSYVASASQLSSTKSLASHVPRAEETENSIGGRNACLDPVTKRDFEEKRQRHKEHLAAIKTQMDEKQQLKELAEERKRQEEMQEEIRLQNEQKRIQQQFEQEQFQQKQEQEEKEKRAKLMENAINKAREEALLEKKAKRLQHLQKHGHDISQLQAKFQEVKNSFQDSSLVEPAVVPGLEGPGQPNTPALSTERQYQRTPIVSPASSSGQMDCGTQAGPGLVDWNLCKMSEVEIEYHGRQQTEPSSEDQRNQRLRDTKKKKEIKAVERPGHLKIEDRPKWGYANKNGKVHSKQSEKDPFYEKKKKLSEMRKLQRQKELNKIVLSKQGQQSKQQCCGGEREREMLDVPGNGRAHQRAVKAIYQNVAPSEQVPNSMSKYKTRECNTTNNCKNLHAKDGSHIYSPPVPALRRKIEMDGYHMPKECDVDGANLDFHKFEPLKGVHKNDNQEILSTPFRNFVPFTRTVEILDPAKATSPLPISREGSHVVKARNSYRKGQLPGNYGNKVENYVDDLWVDESFESCDLKDPLFNPHLIKDHPTARQDIILNQLSNLKKTLMQRQRELETSMHQ